MHRHRIVINLGNARLKYKQGRDWPQSCVNRRVSMKSLRTVLLGVAIAAATLSSVAPAFALGGCGRNYHRNAYGRCVWGVKIKAGA